MKKIMKKTKIDYHNNIIETLTEREVESVEEFNEMNGMSRLECIYELSYENKEILEVYKKYHCFFCSSEGNVDDINLYINDLEGETALCPKCQIDSLIPDIPELGITDKLIEEMRDKYFGNTVILK